MFFLWGKGLGVFSCSAWLTNFSHDAAASTNGILDQKPLKVPKPPALDSPAKPQDLSPACVLTSGKRAGKMPRSAHSPNAPTYLPGQLLVIAMLWVSSILDSCPLTLSRRLGVTWLK